MDAVRSDDEVICLRICVSQGNVNMSPRFGYTSDRRFPTHCRSCQTRAEQLHNVAAERAERAGVRPPEAGLIDGEKQSTASIAVLPSHDRHAPLLQRVAHTKLAQGPDGIAGKVETEPGVRRSVMPFDESGSNPPLIERVQHGEAGNATPDNEHAA
jgi:hypothetical protein